MSEKATEEVKAETPAAEEKKEEEPKAAEEAGEAKAEDEKKAEGDGEKTGDADEIDTGAHFEPVVKLEKVEVSNAEEDEDVLFKKRAKLFRFDLDNSEWKERGLGFARFLQHKETKKVRFILRREKTLKVAANHFVLPGMTLEPNAGSDRSWMWSTPADFADGEAKKELLAIRFASSEEANEFKTKFEECVKINEKIQADESK